MSAVLEQLNDEMASLVGHAKGALVEVRNSRGSGGAGTVWHPDGLVITNAHVAHGHRLLVTLADGRTVAARLLARDADLDLAALGVEATGLRTMELGDSRRLRPGEWVMAIGHPRGVRGAAAAGIVIGAGADVPHLRGLGREWIMTSLPLRPGYSGGPLLEASGRLVGINSAMTGVEGGLAVPVHTAITFLREALGSGGLRVA